MSSGDAGNAAASSNGGGEAAGGGESQGPDLASLASSLESMQAGQEELRSFLTSEPWRQQEAPPEPEAEADTPFDLSFLDDPGIDPQQMSQKLGELVSQVAEQRVQEHLKPVNERFESERRNREAASLVAEFPEMAEPETQKQVIGFAKQVAETYKEPHLAQEPWFLRLMFMAGRAADAAQEEGDPPPAAHLEGGSGARPGAQQVDLAQQIISPGTRRGGSALPF